MLGHSSLRREPPGVLSAPFSKHTLKYSERVISARRFINRELAKLREKLLKAAIAHGGDILTVRRELYTFSCGLAESE